MTTTTLVGFVVAFLAAHFIWFLFQRWATSKSNGSLNLKALSQIEQRFVTRDRCKGEVGKIQVMQADIKETLQRLEKSIRRLEGKIDKLEEKIS